MPAPKPDLMKQFVRAKFTSFAIKVPPNWQTPTGEAGDQYNNAFKPEEKNVAPGSPPLVQPATMNKYHVDNQKMLIAAIGSFIDKSCDAICEAWDNWHKMAALVGVIITGPVASVGQVLPVPWTPVLMAKGPKDTPQQLKYWNAIATTLETAWQTYTATIKVPGLPWYPAFAAVTSPVAPPTDNVPCPVQLLTQVPVSLAPELMKTQMIGKLADPMAPHHDKLFEAICDGFDKCFQIWTKSTLVTGVKGTGPVPTFAPPYVPVGPVLGGVGIMAPGGFK